MQIITSHWHCSLKLRWQKAMHFHQPKIHASQIYEQWIFQTWTRFQCTEVCFASFLSGESFTVIVVNPPERKMANAPLCSGMKERTLVFIAHSFAASLEPANWLSNSRVLNSRVKCTVKMQTCINVCSCSFSLDCQLMLWFIIYILGKKKKYRGLCSSDHSDKVITTDFVSIDAKYH